MSLDILFKETLFISKSVHSIIGALFAILRANKVSERDFLNNKPPFLRHIVSSCEDLMNQQV